MTLPLVDRLRQKIHDERYHVPAFTLTVGDADVTHATLEVGGGRLILTTMGGAIAPLNFDLSDDKYVTIGLLARALDSLPGIECRLDDGAEYGHLSTDLEPHPLTTLISAKYDPSSQDPMARNQQPVVTLRHHLFADDELVDILDEATLRHNPSYSLPSLPPNEDIFVMHLAMAQVLRVQAMDVVKRRNLDQTVKSLLEVADTHEKLYQKDTERLARVLPSPALSPSQQAGMGQGDVVVGRTFRRSLRTGRLCPGRTTQPPNTALLLAPQDGDLSDTSLVVRWQRQSQDDAAHVELWRDFVPDVRRGHHDGDGYLDRFNLPRDAMRSPTARLIFASGGQSRGYGVDFGRSYLFGQPTCAVCDVGDFRTQQQPVPGGLEPETTYYYRLFVFDHRRDAIASEPLGLTTLPARARFLSPTAALSAGLYGGEQVLFQLRGADAACVITVDGKPLDDAVFIAAQPATPSAPATAMGIVGKVPQFAQPGRKNVCLTSPTGLIDTLLYGLNVLVAP